MSQGHGRRYRDKEWLRRQYHTKENTLSEIGDKCGCSKETIRRWMEKYGIERRDSATREPVDDSRLKDRGWLYRKYHIEGFSLYDIADVVGVEAGTVGSYMEEHGIDRREKTHHNPDVDDRLSDGEWLHKAYVECGMSLSEIADECSCHHETVRSRLIDFNIERRKSHENKPPAHRLRDNRGYERIDHKACGQRHHVLIHRLVAVAHWGFDEVSGNVVHHKNRHKIDNRPSNLEVLSKSEHSTIHT